MYKRKELRDWFIVWKITEQLFPVIKITGNKVALEYTLTKYTMIKGLAPFISLTYKEGNIHE
tara:strand:- start:630 stop:815 length:186 start_codon:yes stop_codon:yes gene_type:complete